MIKLIGPSGFAGNESGDLSTVVEAATDVSPWGRDLPKPAYELTATK
jgi:hypothetical protein